MEPDPRWVNQYAYDTMWKGEKIRVYIKRLKPISDSDDLFRACTVSAGSFVRAWLEDEYGA